MHKATYYA